MEIQEGIVLSVTDYDERDGLVTVFFKDGRVMSIYAQGIQNSDSKNRLNLMQFSVVELEYFQKKDRNKAKLMRSITLIEPTMKSLADIHLLVGLSSLIDFRLAAGTRVYELFRFIIKEIEFRSVANSLILHFLFAIMKLDNVQLKFNECAICGNEDYLVSWDAKRGGMICEYDLKPYNKKLSKDLLEKIREINFEKDFNKLESILLDYDDYKMLKENLLSYLEDILGLYVEPLRKYN